MPNNKDIKKQLKNIEVEFLHGVPVKLPARTIDQLLELFGGREMGAGRGGLVTASVAWTKDGQVLQQGYFEHRANELQTELLDNKDKAEQRAILYPTNLEGEK